MPMADTRTMAQLLPKHNPPRGYSEALLLDKKNPSSSATSSSSKLLHRQTFELSCVTCGGAQSHQKLSQHSWQRLTGTNISEYVTQAAGSELQQQNNLQNPVVTANTASTYKGQRDTPWNTVTNPGNDLKGITTRSGVAYQGPPIPTSSVVKPIPEVTKDQVHPSCSQSTAPVQPPVGPEPITTPVLEPIVAPVVAPVPNTKPTVSLPYPSRRDNEKSLGKSFQLPDLTPTCMTLETCGCDQFLNQWNCKGQISVKVGVFSLSPPADFVPILPMNEPTEVELKNCLPHLEYAFLEGDNKLPVILAKVGWYQPEFVPTRFLWKNPMHQRSNIRRRVNPQKSTMLLKRKVEKLLEAGIDLPISDIPGSICSALSFSLYSHVTHTHTTTHEGTGRRYGGALKVSENIALGGNVTTLGSSRSSKLFPKDQYILECPDCEDSQFSAFIKSCHISASIGNPIKLRSGYHQKDRKPSQNDKTEHGMEKTVQNQGQSPKMPKSESILKNTIECNLNPSDGPGKPNSIFMKTVKTKWALNHLQQPICVHLTKTVKTLKAQS
ncbi:hypothetical protein Tco_0245852 [Tanacetum coccineum]